MDQRIRDTTKILRNIAYDLSRNWSASLRVFFAVGRNTDVEW